MLRPSWMYCTVPALFALALLGCSDHSVAPESSDDADPREAQKASVIKEELGGVFPFVLPCIGEMIQFSGTRIVVINEFTDPNGNTHFKMHSNYANAKAVGLTTGVEYQFLYSENNSYFFGSSYPIHGTHTETTRLVNPHTGEGIIEKRVYHVTVSGNGTVTSEVDSYVYECN